MFMAALLVRTSNYKRTQNAHQQMNVKTNCDISCVLFINLLPLSSECIHQHMLYDRQENSFSMLIPSTSPMFSSLSRGHSKDTEVERGSSAVTKETYG